MYGILRSLVIVATACAVPGEYALAQQTADLPLRGLRAVSVIIEDLPPAAAQAGLSLDQIRTDVELALRRTGMTVEENRGDPHVPSLYVRVDYVSNSRTVAWDTEVSLLESARLLRDSSIVVWGAKTWSSIGHLGCGSTTEATGESIRRLLSDDVNQFLNRWLAANPGRR